VRIAEFWWLMSAVVVCVFEILVHILWVRLFPSRGLYRALLAGFLAGGALFAAMSWATFDRPFGQHLANLGIYICFSYVYFHWNNMSETARRVRLTIELLDHEKGLTREEILTRYNGREIVDLRIRRLLGSRQIEWRGNRVCRGNPSVLMMATIMGRLRQILRAPPFDR